MLTDNLTLLSKPTSFPLEGLHSSTMEQAYLIFIRKSIHYLTIKKKKNHQDNRHAGILITANLACVIHIASKIALLIMSTLIFLYSIVYFD